MTFDPIVFAAQLKEAGVPRVTVEPSGMSGSPYDHVYVYLTERDGPHLIISAGREYGEKGILCGVYRDHESAGRVKRVYDYAAAQAWVEGKGAA